MDPLLIKTKVETYFDIIAAAQEKIAYYEKMGESGMKAKELAYWTKEVNSAKTAIQLLEAGEATTAAATTAEVGAAATSAEVGAATTAAEVGAATSTGEAAAGHIIPRVLDGIGRLVSAGAVESAPAAVAVGAATVIATLVASGIVTWAAANAVGKMMADKPIEPVAAKANSNPPGLSPFDAKPANSKDEFFIYSVNSSGLSLFVGRPSDVEGRKATSVTDAGNGSDIVVFTKIATQAFDSREKAIDYLKANVTTGKDSVWTGHWVKLGGQEYRTVHVGNLGK